MKPFFAACLIALSIAPASAQERDGDLSDPIEAEVYQRTQLSAGTAIVLEMTQTVTTQGDSWEEGDQFSLIVSEDVLLDGQVVIPKGTLAVGHVRWATGRGAFGKSGKIEVAIDHLLLGNRPVKLTGVYREEGKGGLTSAGSMVAAGPLAGFITGESGEILRGSLLTAYLAENLGVVIRYRPNRDFPGTSAASSVRARQIPVAEAFGQIETAANRKNAKSVSPPSPAFKDAFREEIASINKDQ